MFNDRKIHKFGCQKMIGWVQLLHAFKETQHDKIRVWQVYYDIPNPRFVSHIGFNTCLTMHLKKKIVGLNASVIIDTKTPQTFTNSTFVDIFGLHVESYIG